VNLPPYKSVIALNGFINLEMIHLLNKTIPVLAADGAALKLSRLGITPAYIVGDKDSYEGESSCFILAEDQNYTDFEKTILFARRNQLMPALIVGVNGGEIDHILGNIMAILKHAEGQDLFFLDAYESGEEMRYKLGIPVTQELCLQLPKNTLVSMIATEETCLSTQGLCWEFASSHIYPQGILPIRNVTVSPEIVVTVHKGKVLLIVDCYTETHPKRIREGACQLKTPSKDALPFRDS
jgi:thiamine pyrophosphokinase